MRFFDKFMLLAGCAALGACGGGGEGVVSTPAPVPAPTPSPTPTPTPTGTAISNLTASETFSDEAATADVSLATADGFVQTTASSLGPMTVSYDAATGNYTVSTDGRAQTFGLADEQPQRWDGERRFTKAGDSEYLTLVTTPYLSTEFSNKYVGMGYWQRNALSAGMQQTYFSTFTFGFDTPVGAVPRSGSAHWLTDIFGILSVPDKEWRVIQGQGDFTVDFADGTFVSKANLSESNIVTNGGATGSLRLSAGGFLDSSSGFSGLISYNGVDTSLQGSIAGSFYGPNAEEIGAAFSAAGAGATLTGALTGQQSSVGSTSDGVRNISLTNLLADQRFFGSTIWLGWTTIEREAGNSGLLRGMSAGTANYTLVGGLQVIGFDEGRYDVQAADIDADGPANFTTYRSSRHGNPLTVRTYKIGDSNSEIALTYSSFVNWQSSEDRGIPSGQTTETFYRRYLVYGLPTDVELTAGRTGHATYNGVVHGIGANMRSATYDVGGTSHFAVDFSAGSYDGRLMLTATDDVGTMSDFGQWTFAGTLANGGLVEAPLVGPGTYFPNSKIYPTFYGPTGQEIGATFNLGIGLPENEDSIEVVGVTLAKE